MARRSSEEILAQREAWMARRARRDAGEDIPFLPPLKAGEEAPEDIEAEIAEEPDTVEPQEIEEVEAEAAPEPEPEPEASEAAAPQPSGVSTPQKPAQRRTSAEILAQREAWMARKAAPVAGVAPPAPAEPTPAPAAPKEAASKAAAPRAAPRAAATPKPEEAPRPKIAPPEPAAPRPGRRREPQPAEPIDPNITRRELLNYAWLASIGLFTAQTVGLSLWFAYPNFLEGQFGGQFRIGSASSILPQVNSGPIPYTDGKFWLVNVDDTSPDGTEERKGVLAIFKVCTHLGCLYEWVTVTTRFECPCHGSRFALTGDYLAGPARRSLDRFVIQALAADGSVRAETNANGDPLIVEPDDILVVDTGQRILGSSDIIPA